MNHTEECCSKYSYNVSHNFCLCGYCLSFQGKLGFGVFAVGQKKYRIHWPYTSACALQRKTIRKAATQDDTVD